MNAALVIVLILPVLVVSLVITVDTVFRTLEQWFPKFESQLGVITFLYFVYLYILIALSTFLLGEIIFEYTLALFIAHYFFKKIGKILLVITPFFILLSAHTSGMLTNTSNWNIILLGLLQLTLYLIYNETPLVKKKWSFKLLFLLTTYVSIYFRWDDIKNLQNERILDVRLLILLGALIIVSVFNVYYNMREKEIRHHREVILQSKKDLLTGSYNFTALNEVIELLKNESVNVVVGMIDLDLFKSINDKHGHLVGNIVLKEFIDVLRGQLSLKIDATQFEIYRFGGEEFCLFFYDLSEKEVFTLLDDFSIRLKEQGVIVDEDVRIDLTFSAGIASNDDYEKDLLTTIERADTACYYSKEFGRNQITLYEKLDNKTRKNQHLEGNF
ncbi:GGDEF domain-containing protein [Enterococcus sp. DIV1314a]|uniref:GGDEF domain-containing protein n=1 Tax=Enterococcus sp. DIV1314a TaxID=2774660 RepID=UPI003F1FF409